LRQDFPNLFEIHQAASKFPKMFDKNSLKLWLNSLFKTYLGFK